jgi:hypothetical protein
VPLSQIAVEIVVPDAPRAGTSQKKNPVEPSELRRALLQACSDTVQVAVCVPADTARQAAALAIVFWKPGGRVRIEVGAKDSPGGQTWTSREIDFSPRDAPLERWRAAGYAAGTLASLVVRADRSRAGSPPPAGAEEKPARDAESAAPAPAPAPTISTEPKANAASKKEQPRTTKPPTPRPPEPSPEHEEEVADEQQKRPPRISKLWAWSFDAAGLFGSGITVSHPRAGGLFRVNRAFGGPFVAASVGYAVEQPLFIGLTVDWFLPSLGAGYVFQLGSAFTAEVRAELVAELLHGHAEDAATGDASTAYRWLGGGRLGLGAAWAPFDAVSLFAGGAISARGPETDILMKNLVQISTSILACQGEAGLRFTVR